MFILQDGKLYIQEKKGIVGVSVYYNKLIIIKDTETSISNHEKLSAFEVRCRYNITEETPYIFPKEVKEVIKNEPTTETKETIGKS